MKTMLKLTELNKREMNRIIGGDIPCACGCYCGCAPNENHDTVQSNVGSNSRNKGQNAKSASNKD